MPGMDGTGPRGLGPMTGGGRGWCNPYFAGARSPSGVGNPYYMPYGGGSSYGYGGGSPYGYGMGYAPYPSYGRPPFAPYRQFGFGRGGGFGRGRGARWGW